MVKKDLSARKEVKAVLELLPEKTEIITAKVWIVEKEAEKEEFMVEEKVTLPVLL
jgi:hypothetical protein